jgi:F-type H+-transporting ATPase subunit b
MGSSLIQPETGTILWTVVTFVILAVLLARFAWRPLLATLEERERSIRESLEQSQKARAEAEETLRRNQEILAGARRETAAIIEQGKREAEAVRNEIVTRARAEAQTLVEQGRAQLAFEQKQAVEQLRREVADLAIQAAERIIARSLDDARQRELVDEYVRGLPALRREDARR